MEQRTPPSHVYRFRGPNREISGVEGKSLENELYQLVENGAGFVSPLLSQNDLFEGRPCIEQATYWEIKKFRNDLKRRKGQNVTPSGRTADELLEAHPETKDLNVSLKGQVLDNFWTSANMRKVQRAALEHVLSMTSIACFNAARPSQLMWAHYASSHTGVCFRFEVSDNAAKHAFFEVRYRDDRPRISGIDLMRFQAGTTLNDPSFSKLTSKDFENDLLLAKSKDWGSEQEWRWVDFEPNRRNPYAPMSGLNLQTIICGARASNDTIGVCRELAAQKIQVTQCQISETNYDFKYVPLN